MAMSCAQVLQDGELPADVSVVVSGHRMVAVDLAEPVGRQARPVGLFSPCGAMSVLCSAPGSPGRGVFGFGANGLFVRPASIGGCPAGEQDRWWRSAVRQ